MTRSRSDLTVVSPILLSRALALLLAVTTIVPVRAATPVAYSLIIEQSGNATPLRLVVQGERVEAHIAERTLYFDFANRRVTEVEGENRCDRRLEAVVAAYAYSIASFRVLMANTMASTRISEVLSLPHPEPRLWQALSLLTELPLEPSQLAALDSKPPARFSVSYGDDNSEQMIAGHSAQLERPPAKLSDWPEATIACGLDTLGVVERLTSDRGTVSRLPVIDLPEANQLDKAAWSLMVLAAAPKRAASSANLASALDAVKNEQVFMTLKSALDPLPGDTLHLLDEVGRIDFGKSRLAWWQDWTRAGLIVRALELGQDLPTRFADPLPYYLRVLEAAPGFPPLYGELGDYFARFGDFALAWAFYDRGRSLFGGNHPAFSTVRNLEARLRQDYPHFFVRAQEAVE